MNPGSKIKVHYTGTLDDGTVFDSSEGKEPLEFTIGENQVIEGFENVVKGMSLNQEKTFKIESKDAYGSVNDQLITDVPREKFPPQIEVEGRLILKGPDRQNIPAVVTEVKEDVVTIDLNHPLAGKDLTFRIKIVGIN